MSQGEGIYPAPAKKIAALDARIMNVQKSTRAAIPAMIPLHDVLRQKFRWYYNWSAFPGAKIVHSAVLLIYLLGASAFTANLFYSPQKATAASVKTWDASSDWKQWKLDNLSADLKEGSLVLAPESVKETPAEGASSEQQTPTAPQNETPSASPTEIQTQPPAAPAETQTEQNPPAGGSPVPTTQNILRQIAGEEDQAQSAPDAAPADTNNSTTNTVPADTAAPATDNQSDSTVTPATEPSTQPQTQTSTPTQEVKKEITYKTSGSATIELTPKKDEVVDWLSYSAAKITNDQTLTIKFSTDQVIWAEDIAKLQNTETLYIKVEMATANSQISPELQSFQINYSRLPQKPKALDPSNGNIIQDKTPTLKASKFEDPDKDNHRASRWQLTNQISRYDSPMIDKIVEKKSTSFNVGNKLTDGVYSWRVKYQDTTGAWSLWSDEAVFVVGQIPQDIKSERTENTKTFDNGNGVKTLEAHAGVIHYKENYGDAKEEWKDINPYHTIDTPNFVLHDQMPATVKVFKEKIGYEIESRKSGAKYKVELVETDKPAKVKEAKADSNKIGLAGLKTAKAAAAADSGNVDFDFEIGLGGVRLWKTIEGPDAPKQFKWKVTKTGEGNDLKFRENPEAFEKDHQNKKVEIATDKTKIDSHSFIWRETAPKTDLTIDTDTDFYPNAHPESTSVDGSVSDEGEFGWSWAQMVAAAGTSADDSSSPGLFAGMFWYFLDGQWESIFRSIFVFDTSSLPDDATINSATLSLWGTSKSDCATAFTPDINIYSSAPASNTALVAGDYDSLGSTAFSDSVISYNSWSTSAYNTFTLNASGRGNISKTGVSKFGARNANKDVAIVEPPGQGGDCTAGLSGNFAEAGGAATTNDPKLTVSYTEAGISIGGSTNAGDGITVKVAVNGVAQAQTTTTGSGSWTISGVTVSSGQVVTTWLDGVADSAESTAVTKYDGSGNITGMVLNTNVLTIGSADNQSLTVTNVGAYDCSSDEDVMMRVASSTLDIDTSVGAGSCAGSATNAYTDPTINTLGSNTLTIGASETLSAHNTTITGTLVATTTAALNVGGDWTNNGTYTKGSETVTLNGSEAQTVAGSAATSFTSVTVSNTTAAIAINTNINISGTLTVNASAIVTPAAAVVINTAAAAGTITGSGRVNVTRTAATADYSNQYKFSTNTLTNLTVAYTGGGAQSVSAVTYGNLTIDMSGQTATAAGSFEVGKVLNINAGTFDASSATLTLSGTDGTPFIKTGTFTANTSTIAYTGNASGNTNVAAATYYDLTLNNGSETYAAAGDIGVSHVLTITAGTFDASNRTITLSGTDGTPFVKTGTFTASTSTIIYSGNNGGGDTTVVSTTYNNLQVTGAENYNSAGTVTVSATLTIGVSATYYTNAQTLTVGTLDNSNNLKIQGGETVTITTMDTNTGTVTYVGDGDQTRENFWLTDFGTPDYYHLTINSTTTGANSDQFFMHNNLNVAGNLTITNGNFQTFTDNTELWSLTITGTLYNDQVLYLHGPETFSIGTWDIDSGSVVYVGRDQAETITLKDFGDTDYYTVAVLDRNATQATYNITNSLVAAGQLWAQGGTFSANGQTVTVAGMTYVGWSATNDSGTYQASTATQTFNGGLTISKGTFTGSSGLVDVNGDLTINSTTTFTAPNTLNVNGDFANSGDFTAGSGIVNLDGGAGTTQEISGNTTFNDLSATAATARTLQFAGSSNNAVGGTWTVTGSAGQLITLQSSDTNSWTINPTAASVSYVSVSRSTNSGVTFCATYSTSGGNNSGWNISATDSCVPTAASGVNINTITTTGFTVGWNDNSDNESGFKVYISTVPNADCSLATYPGAPDYTAGAGVTSQAVTDKSVNTQYCAKVASYNGFGDAAAAYAAAAKYTLANTPSAPTVNATSTTSLTVIINANSNPASTEFAIYNETAAQYVQADGTLGAGAVWQNRATWGGDAGIANTGLSVNTTYTYKVKARNGDATETDLSAGASKYTLANTPDAPTVNATSTTSLTVIINANSNPAATEFAISCDNDATFLNYSTNACEAIADDADHWRTYANWGGAAGFADTGLSVNTQHTYKVKARNGDNTETDLSSGASKYTLANTPSAPTVVANSWTSGNGNSITVTINANSNPASTEFAISCDGTPTNWLQGDGTCAGSKIWKTKADWETGTVNYLKNLTADTEYTILTLARNGDNTETSNSSTAVATTAPAQVANLTHSANTTSSITWSWDANATAPDGYNIYEYSGGACTDTQKATTAHPNTTVEEGSLSANTQYTRCARAYRGALTGEPSSSTAAYSSIETPTGITFGTIAADSIQISASGTLSNLAGGTSGLYFTETTGANGGGGAGFETWTKTNDLTDSGLSVNTQYTYKVKARNGDSDETAETATSSKYTLANAPDAPTVNATSATSLTVIINAASNPASTEFAIYNDTLAQYVQADGTLGAGKVWQNRATWGGDAGIANTGLSVNTTYTYKVKARNGDSTETDLSAGASKYTLANTPDAPTVNATSATSLTVIINAASNPASTEFAIYNETSAQYVQADGTLGAGEVWQNRATWGGDAGIANTGLSVNTQYTYKVKAQNGDGTDTDLSSGTAKYTLANDSSAPTVAANSWDAANGNSITVTINANSNPAGTEFAIACDGTPTNWLQGDGTCAGSKIWKTKADWETGTTNYLKNLTADTEYTILTLARNGDGTETNPSGTAATTTAPAQPTGLAHTANTTTTITWDWNDNVSAPDGYNLLSNTDETLETAVGASTVTQDQSDAGGTALTANTQYTVKVRAYRGALVGQPSDTDAAYTSIETPTGITFGTIAADSIQISASGTLSNLASDNSGLYFTETTGVNGGGGTGFETWTKTNDLTDSGLAVNTQYTYKVKARNGDSDETAETATSNKYTLANTPAAPTVAANYSVGNSYYADVTIAANSNPAGTNYKITWDTDAGGAFGNTLEDWTAHTNGDTVTHTDLPGGLTCNQTYYYRVIARNGDAAETAAAMGSDTTPPCGPANPVANNITASSATFNWDAVAGPAATYTTSYGTDAAATNLGETAGIADTSLAQPGLDPSTTYYFKVKATNTNGTGAWSAIDDFTTLAGDSTLLLKLPGQTFTAGSGISGTPSTQTAGTAFTGTVYAVDNADQIVNVSDTITFMTTTDTWIATYNNGDSHPADDVTLTAGQKNATFTFYKAGTHHVINMEGSSGSSSQFTVVPATTSASVSTATLSAASVEVGQTAVLTIRLKDAYGNNIPSHAVTVSSNQAGDVITYSASSTASDGTILAYITSGLVHTSTLTITDTTDSITLNTTPTLEFTEPTSIDNPANFTGTAGDSQTTLSWQNPSDAFFSYVQIYRSQTSGELGALIATTGGTGYTDTGLTNDTTYYYTLKAVDSYGNVSTGTYQLALTPTAEADTEAPSAPRNLRAKNITANSIVLKWDAATDNVGVVGYLIYNAETGIQIGATTATEFTLNNLTPDTAYQFYVKAYDGAGNVSGPSNTITVRTLTSAAAEEQITPAIAAFLVIANAPSQVYAGQPFSHDLKVLAADAGGALIKTYRGSVYFTSSDADAKLKWTRTAAYTFTSADSGSHEFSGRDFILNTLGEQKLSVTDGRTTGSAAIEVLPYGLRETYQKVQNKVTDFFTANADRINTAVVTTTAALLLTPLLINLLISLGNLGPELLYWLGQLLQLLGLRRRRKPWGVVFNSLTGQPIVMAVVRIYDKEYNRLLETAVTDREGRYGFLTKPGAFYIVAQKSGFVFPSAYKASSYFENLYTGGNFVIGEAKEKGISYNIPLDPEVKASAVFNLTVWAVKLAKVLRKLRWPLLVAGIVFAVIMTIFDYDLIYLLSIVFYLFIMALEYLRSLGARPYGVVTDTYNHPLEMTIVRIFDKHSGRLVETDVTDTEGRYKFLVKPGIYYLTAAKPGYMDYKSHLMYLEKERTMVSSNLKLRKAEKK